MATRNSQFRDPGQPVPAARALRRGAARRPGRLHPRSRRAPARARTPCGRRLRADRGRATLARGAACRPADDPGARSERPTTAPALEQALVENVHRDDLNPLEEAAAYQQLIEDFGLRTSRWRRASAGAASRHQHAAAPPVAARDPAMIQERHAHGPRPRAARHARPRVPGAAGAKACVNEDLSVRAVEEPSERTAAMRRAVRAPRPGSAPPAGACSSSRSCSATTSRPA